MLRFSEPSAVVIGGPYAFIRNPPGALPVRLGVLLGSLVPFAVVPAILAMLHFRFVLREEPYLAEKFGQEYASYRIRVRNWL